MLYQKGLLSHDTIYGKQYYENMDRESAINDSKQFANAVLSEYSPASIIELGCGTGRLLYPYREQGLEVRGVELSSVAQEVSRLSSNHFEEHDLTDSYYPEREYDIVLCIEVLEHLPEAAADTIVDSICRSAPVAIITAATPGQGGTHHVNEKPHDYWINRFEDRNMRHMPEKTEIIKSQLDLNELVWIKENLLVFEKDN
jgi:2-polyprenyl-3-methyl-5-hydroxy-6-metoxy-1,4-benzoquinol methylase